MMSVMNVVRTQTDERTTDAHTVAHMLCDVLPTRAVIRGVKIRHAGECLVLCDRTEALFDLYGISKTIQRINAAAHVSTSVLPFVKCEIRSMLANGAFRVLYKATRVVLWRSCG